MMATPPPSPQLVYLDAQGQAIVTCPQCTKRAQVSAAAYRDCHALLKSTCTCGHCFPFLLDTRHFYRKAVHLSGRYTPLDTTTKRRMTVVNLSMSGVHFDMLLPHALQIDDVVELVFHLDDQRCTEIHQKAIVHWVDDKKIGAAFCDLRVYEGNLGFYLRPA